MNLGARLVNGESMAFSSFINEFVGAGLRSTANKVSSEPSPSLRLLTDQVSASTMELIARAYLHLSNSQLLVIPRKPAGFSGQQ